MVENKIINESLEELVELYNLNLVTQEEYDKMISTYLNVCNYCNYLPVLASRLYHADGPYSMVVCINEECSHNPNTDGGCNKYSHTDLDAIRAWNKL